MSIPTILHMVREYLESVMVDPFRVGTVQNVGINQYFVIRSIVKCWVLYVAGDSIYVSDTNNIRQFYDMADPNCFDKIASDIKMQ